MASGEAAQGSTKVSGLEKAGTTSRILPVVLALVSVYVIWGSTYLAIRLALEGGFPPFMMGAIRFLIAGALLFVFLRVRGMPAPTARQWRGAATVGLLLLVGGNGGVIVAEQWVSSSLAAVWIGTMPLWAALFSGLWGRWPTRFEWLGLGLGLVGVVLLNLEGDFRANPVGALALVVATIGWALGSVWSQHLPLPGGLMNSAGEMLCAGAAFLAISLVVGERFTGPVTWGGATALGYLVVFGSLVAFSAYLYLLRRVRPALATSYAYVNPLVAVGLGVGFAGEQITPAGAIAIALILAAVVLVAAARGRKQAAS